MASPRTAAGRASWRRAALVLTTAVGIALVPVPAGAEEPGSAAEAASLLAERGHRLEVVTEEFLEAREALLAQQSAATAAVAAATEAQAAVDGARQQVRGIARSAWTGEGLGSFQALLTSDSAEEFVDRVALLETVAGHHGVVLGRAVAAGEVAAQARIVADRAAAEAQARYDAVAAQQADLERQIAEYQADYARLGAEERRAALEAAAAAHGAEEAPRASRDAGRAEEPVAAAAPVQADSGTVQKAVDTALAQLGKPYVWAAAGPGSYDCSGLVQYAYAAAGLRLPHSSRMQSSMGSRVSRGQAQVGDLVAFYSPVSHIGIYLGDGRMVHAPTSGDVVRIASVDAMGATPMFNRIA